MKVRWLVCIVAATGLIGFFAGTAFTEDPAPSDEEMAKMMEMMMELGKPAAAHKTLEFMIGTWEGTSTFYGMPGAEPQTSTATSTNRWILGGRFLQTEYSGSFMGNAFNGHGLLGHDNFKKRYESLWMDSWSSNLYLETGTASDDGKTITMNGAWEGPMGKFPMKHVYLSVGPDEYRMEGYATRGGQEVKEMVIVFKRKKASASPSPLPSQAPVCRPRFVSSKGPGY